MSTEKKVVRISEVIDMLENGKTRPEIREELGLTASEITLLFKHPQLKGRRAKQPTNLEIIDDWAEESEKVIAKQTEEVMFEDTEAETVESNWL